MWIFIFFFNDTATTEIYTLSLHDALPICGEGERSGERGRVGRERGVEREGGDSYRVRPSNAFCPFLLPVLVRASISRRSTLHDFGKRFNVASASRSSSQSLRISLISAVSPLLSDMTRSSAWSKLSLSRALPTWRQRWRQLYLSLE